MRSASSGAAKEIASDTSDPAVDKRPVSKILLRGIGVETNALKAEPVVVLDYGVLF